MPTTQRLHDLAVNHRIQLGRYSNTVVRDVIGLLNRTDADIVSRITRGDFDGQAHTRAELELLLDEVRQMVADGWSVAGQDLVEQLDALAGSEQEFSRSLVETGAAQVEVQLQSMRLTAAQVVAAVKARPFQGKFLADWLSDVSAAAQRRVVEAIRQGFVESQSIDEIVRRIRGTRLARYQDGILEINRRAAEAMVRTAITHTSSVAANEVYQDAADVIEAIVWVATLDSRTTLICIGLDGKPFPLDSGPRPPAHINCRSTTIPLLKGMTPFGRITYPEWFKTQPAEVQAEILGASRMALYQKGGLKLDSFTDDKQHVLTLDELRRKDASAFARAGV